VIRRPAKYLSFRVLAIALDLGALGNGSNGDGVVGIVTVAIRHPQAGGCGSAPKNTLVEQLTKIR